MHWEKTLTTNLIRRARDDGADFARIVASPPAEAPPSGASEDWTALPGVGVEDRPVIGETPPAPGAPPEADRAPVLPGNDSLEGLAHMAGVAALAGEATESVRPADTLEALQTHELVAGHAFAMNVLSQANNQFLSVTSRATDFDHLTRLNQATARTGLVGVRMMEAVRRGILLLDRLRHGARYTMTIERADNPPGDKREETRE